MSFIQNIIRQIFPRPEAIVSGKEPVVSGPLKRSERFMEKFRKWTENGKSSGVSEKILQSYFDLQVQREPATEIGLFQERGIEGLYMRQNGIMEKEEFHYMLDLLKERVLKLGYRFYHGITESREDRGKIRTKEQYYLKPKLTSMDYPVEQGYGNITLELNLINDEVQYLKVAATTYAGFNYKEPEPFYELMTHLFPDN
jgi:hypothetical protein